MKQFFKIYSLILTLLFSGATLHAQTLTGLADSVFMALHHEEFDSLKPFYPSYNDLKSTYDSMDIEKQAQQVLVAQKQVEYALKRSFKTLKKEAESLDMPLSKLEKDEVRHLVQTQDGKKFSVVEIDCHYKKRAATLFFTAIELNNAWFLGEDFRIEKREVEEVPDYEKIDREAERRREKREQQRTAANQKAEEDSAKNAKIKELEAKKKEKEDTKKLKAEEKAKQKAAREEEKRKKKQELERKKKEKKEKNKADNPPQKTTPADSLPPSPKN